MSIVQPSQQITQSFQRIADCFPEALFLLRPDGTIVATNRGASNSLGITHDQIGKKLMDLVDDSADTLVRYIRTCSRSGSPLPGSIRFQTANSGTLPCRCNAGVFQPRTDTSEALILLRVTPSSNSSQFKILNDRIKQLGGEIIRRQRAEEDTRQAHERLLERKRQETRHAQAKLEELRQQLVHQTRLATIGQMTASIAHEIRNPLGAVRNAAYFLKRVAPADIPKISQYLGIIDQEVDAVDLVIRNMLEMARSKDPVKQSVDLSQLVRDIANRVGAKGTVRLSLSSDPDPFIVNVDPGQFHQVIDNLITNAAHAVEDVQNGTIDVQLRRDSKHDLITVVDNGPGVQIEHRERLFEPLFSTKAKGTGLGLSICRQIVQRHDGKIELQSSQHPGASFCVTLPR